jgi:MFS family permease
MTPANDGLAQRPWLALQCTLAVQMFASFVLSAAPVLAPAVGPGLGIAPERVGLFVGAAYLLAMLSGLRTGHWCARAGPTRVSQVLLLGLAVGLAVATAGTPALLLCAAALVGISYGAANPAAAAILGRHAPRGSTGLFFAMKQAGVPLGVALAGLAMPLGLATLGWQATAWLAALAAVLLAVALSPAQRRLDPRAQGPLPTGAWTALLATLREPALRRLSLMSMAYAMTQLGFITFVVGLLHLEHGLPFATAAALLAASQVACTAARIGFGHAADRWASPGRLLGFLGWAMSACCLALALLPADAGLAWVALAVLACGATAMGWNGVFFAELVRIVPSERMSSVAGATQFFTFAGSMLGPVLFGALVQAGSSYAFAYGLFAVLGAAAGTSMLLASRAQPTPAPGAASMP